MKPFLLLTMPALVLSNLSVSYAEPIIFTPRENVIYTTLNQLQEREDAIRDSMKEAQIRLVEVQHPVEKQKPIAAEMQNSILDGLFKRTHPYFLFEVAYDDNIDLTPDNKKTTIANTYNPGFKINYTGQTGTLNFDANWKYHRHNNRASENLKQALTDLLATFRLGRFNFSVSENYLYDFLSPTEMDLGSGADTNLHWQNTGTATFSRYFNRTGFDIKYKYLIKRYETDWKEDSYVDQTFDFNQYLRLATKTRLLFEYQHIRKAYGFVADPDNSNSDDFRLSVSNILTSKISTLLKSGYKTGEPKVSDDYRELSANGKISYMFSERTDLAFDYTWTNHAQATTTEYYIRNDVKLSGNHRLAFNPKFKFNFSGEFDYAKYPKRLTSPNPEKAKYYIFNMGLTYAFKQWLDFKLNWECKKYKNNVSLGDEDPHYIRNLVTFNADARF